MSIIPKVCPRCGIETNYVWRLNGEKESSEWHRCSCGIAFQSEYPDKKNFNKDYVKEYINKSNHARQKHYAHTYAPIIEEIVHGRKMLDVGFCGTESMQEMERRGWLTWGIDSNKDICGHDNIYKGDFETYDFKRTVQGVSEKEIAGDTITLQYDLIWCTGSLTCFHDPKRAILKMFDLLSEGGCVFLTVPDIDFITKCGIASFPHFIKHENYTLWSKQAIVNELEKIGFEVIVAYRNFKPSYNNYYDVHVVAQKRYY